MRTELPAQAKGIVENYLAIKVGEWRIRCPYFMNVRGVRRLSAVYAGKGTPREIEAEAEKLYRKHLYIDNETSARALLILAGLGVDCSGLVASVLGIQRVKQNTLFRGLVSIFRSQTNISVQLLTAPANSRLVKWEDVMPGDFVKQGRRHVMLVECVDRSGGKPSCVGYVESNISPEWGVQRGEIKIVSPGQSWERQLWSVEEAKERFVRAGERGLFRLKT